MSSKIAKTSATPIKVLHVVHWPNSGITSFLKQFLQSASSSGIDYSLLFFIDDKKESEAFKRRCSGVYSLNFQKNPLQGIREYSRIIRKLKPDVIHTHSFQPGIWGRILSLGTRAKIVSTIHSPYPYLTGRTLFDTLKRFIEISSINILNSRVICVSEAVKQHLRKYTRLNGKLIDVIRNGLSPISENFDLTVARNEIGANGAANKIVITAGRLSEEKGYDVLLAAFMLVQKQIPDISLVILGTGPLEKKLKLTATKLGIASRVKFLGYKEEIHPYLALSHLYVNSSVYEGFGMSLLEAMAAGLPIIASRVGGIPEVIRDGHTGILIELGSPDALANAMLIVLKDESLARRLSEDGLKKVSSDFHIAKTVRDYENLYLNLTNGGEPSVVTSH